MTSILGVAPEEIRVTSLRNKYQQSCVVCRIPVSIGSGYLIACRRKWFVVHMIRCAEDLGQMIRDETMRMNQELQNDPLPEPTYAAEVIHDPKMVAQDHHKIRFAMIDWDTEEKP